MKNLKNPRISIALIFFFSFLFLINSSLIRGLSITNETKFFISKLGNDKNPGSIDKPFLTLEGARDAIRKLKSNGRLLHKNIVVYIRGGNYYRDKSFTLDSIDSGTANSTIIYKCYKNEKVIITGGVNLDITKFSKVTEEGVLNRIIDKNARSHIYKCDLSTNNIDLSSLNDSIINAPELFFNNKPLTLARWPNESYALTGKVTSNKSSKYIFEFKEDRPLLWRKAQDVWLFGYWCHNYDDNIVKMDSVNISNKQIAFSQSIPYGIKESQRYYVFNLLEELDSPGEWYLDRVNKIIYLYPPSPIYKSTISLSQLKLPFITMNNTSYLTIEGLTFESGSNTAIVTSGGQNNTIVGCTIRNISKNAVTINGGHLNGVQSCDIYNTGTGGILINAGERSTLTAAQNYADNNNIYNYARIKKTYSAAVRLNGVGNKASHNKIHDAPHLAIEFRGNDHVIEYNEIYSVVEETDDAGAIYTGRDWTYRGNILRYNYLHDIQGTDGKYGKNGIYLDDSMSSAEVYGNVLENVDRAMLIGGGRDHIISNNLIINCRESIIFDERGITWETLYTLRKNLNQVPYQSDIWKTRYPKLYAMATDTNQGIPSGNTVIKNAIYNTNDPNIAPSVIKYGTVSENSTLSTTEYNMLRTSLYSGGKLEGFVIKDFKSIPVGKIGIYNDKYR